MTTADPANGSRRLEGKVAVITGGASGIGRATARRFVAEGARVVLGDLDAGSLQALGDELGGDAITVAGDASSEADVRALVAAAVDGFGPIDIAFANAGIGSAQRLVDADLDQWTRVLDVNLTGPFLLIKHAGRAMTGGGSIIVTSSLNAVQAGPGMGAYCSSKAGVAMLVQVAALELGPAGIRVNAVAPGLIHTNLTDAMWLLPALVEEYEENTPLGRHGQPDEVANLVTFLASDEAGFISGSQYLVDGGAHTKRYPDVLRVLESLEG
jgi:3-oxoacyl-[acyl-carrier protein] reductase